MLRYLLNYPKSKRKINFKTVKNFFISMYKWYKAEDKNAYQFYYRVTKAPKECLKNGECPCYCEVPQKFMEPEKCEEGCYKEWLPELEFLDKIKKENINPILLERQAKLLLKDNNLKNPYGEPS